MSYLIAALFHASIEVQIWASSILLWEIRIRWPKDTGTILSAVQMTIWLKLWKDSSFINGIYHILLLNFYLQ